MARRPASRLALAVLLQQPYHLVEYVRGHDLAANLGIESLGKLAPFGFDFRGAAWTFSPFFFIVATDSLLSARLLDLIWLPASFAALSITSRASAGSASQDFLVMTVAPTNGQFTSSMLGAGLYIWPASAQSCATAVIMPF